MIKDFEKKYQNFNKKRRYELLNYDKKRHLELLNQQDDELKSRLRAYSIILIRSFKLGNSGSIFGIIRELYGGKNG